ncbi:MAG: phage tail tape measure protein [Hydrogenophilales bacterium]|nr:phage tail tape measure protein [Hydrogenophilales bacterium]
MTFRIGIELGLTGASQVKDGLKDIGGAAKDLAGEFSKGLKDGMDQAVREMNRPMEELKTMANAAAKALDIRPDWKIREEIDKTRKAYDDLKSSGLATTNELARAKDAMKSKVGELRQEMGKWSGDWDEIAGKLDRFGSKLQSIGAKSMIAGAPAILAGKNSIEAEHSLAGIANTSGIDPARAEQTVAAWKAKIAELSVFTNQKQSELVEAMGVMVSRGLDPEKALAMLGPIGNAATATGGKIDDIARTLYATYDNLKVPIDQAAKTLDVLATAGNRGAFELKDMAQYLPSLTAIAGSLKMTGVEATAQIAAAAQVAMKGAGDASQAANNLQNFLLKLSAPDTMESFKKAGINLSAEIKKGLDSGDLIGHIAGVVQQATNGDAEKISTLFRDAQAKQFITPMLANIDEYKAIRDQALAAVGTIDKQKAVMEKTTEEKFKGIGISFDAAIEKSSLFQGVLDKIKGTADWFAANPAVFEPIATVVTALAVGGAGLAAAGVALPAIATGMVAIGAAGPALVLAAPAIATILGVVAAWKVGEAFGTWIYDQITKINEAVGGEKGATLGTSLYDLIEGPDGIQSWPGKIKAKASEWADAGGALLDSLKEGIKAKAGELLNGLGIVAQLEKGIKIVSGTVAGWYKVGADLIDGLWEGIKATMRKPLEAIGDLAKKLPQWAKDLLGIKSPSRVFMAIGQDVGAGLVVGIADTEEEVRKAVEGLGHAAIYAGDAMTLKFIEEQERAILELSGALDTLSASAAAGGAQTRDWVGRFLPADAAQAAVEEMQRAEEAVGQSLTDSIMRGLEGGMDWVETFTAKLKEVFGAMVLRPIIQPIAAAGKEILTGSIGLAASSFANASTGVMGGVGSALSSFFTPGAIAAGMSTGFGLAAANIGAAGYFGGFGANMALAGSSLGTGAIGTAIGAAAPYLLPVLAIASLLGNNEPSDKTAWGHVDLGSGDTSNVGGMTGKKAPREETKTARDAMLATAGSYAEIIRAMGGDIAGELRLSTGERDGLRADFGADGSREIVDTDTDKFFTRLFDAMTERAEGLSDSLRTLLSNFDGTADETLEFATAIKSLMDYTNADPIGEAMEQIRLAGRTTYQAWQDAGTEVRDLAAGFDGTLATAQALSGATVSMYQTELSLVGQIQGMLASTSAMFGDSIRTIELSILDSAGKYDYMRAEIDAAFGSLQTAVDPQVIGDLASQINRLAMESYGLLDAGQRTEAAPDYVAYLREVNTLTVERLDVSQTQIESQHAAMASAIESAMERVAARMQGAADTMQAAASTPVTVTSKVDVDVVVDMPADVEVRVA